MTEYGICPECDNELDKFTNKKYKTILWRCSLCSHEDVISSRQRVT